MSIKDTVAGSSGRDIAIWRRIDDAVEAARVAWYETLAALPVDEQRALTDEYAEVEF